MRVDSGRNAQIAAIGRQRGEPTKIDPNSVETHRTDLGRPLLLEAMAFVIDAEPPVSS